WGSGGISAAGECTRGSDFGTGSEVAVFQVPEESYELICRVELLVMDSLRSEVNEKAGAPPYKTRVGHPLT
ncbi:MAG: hypothetical protein ABLQ96_12440, partial [Candidatus Acidiferrum sp.]